MQAKAFDRPKNVVQDDQYTTGHCAGPGTRFPGQAPVFLTVVLRTGSRAGTGPKPAPEPPRWKRVKMGILN